MNGSYTVFWLFSSIMSISLKDLVWALMFLGAAQASHAEDSAGMPWAWLASDAALRFSADNCSHSYTVRLACQWGAWLGGVLVLMLTACPHCASRPLIPLCMKYSTPQHWS